MTPCLLVFPGSYVVAVLVYWVFINILDKELMRQGISKGGFGSGGATPLALWFYYRMKRQQGRPLGWKFRIALIAFLLQMVVVGVFLLWILF